MGVDFACVAGIQYYANIALLRYFRICNSMILLQQLKHLISKFGMFRHFITVSYLNQYQLPVLRNLRTIMSQDCTTAKGFDLRVSRSLVK